MKQLLRPPIQWLFWLAGLTMLGLAIWSLWSTYQLSAKNERLSEQTESAVVPDMAVLQAPSVRNYRQMINSPLFWEVRRPPVSAVFQRLKQPKQPAFTAPKPPPIPIDKTLPEGRLVGIIRLGKKSYGVMRGDEDSFHLHQGDKWGNWTVSKVEKDRLILELEGDREIIPLIGSFEAPKENPKLLAAKRLQKQQKLREESLARLRARQAARQQQKPEVNQNKASQEPKKGMPNPLFPADIAKEPPVLSIKDALDARRRLMESRWGSILGSELPSAPVKPVQPSESKP